MKSIRRNVFETNSSSMHSLSIVQDGKTIGSGRVYFVVPEDYGWYAPDLTEPEEKLSYLMSLIASYSGVNWALYEKGAEVSEEEFLSLPDVKRVIDAVENHGCLMHYKKGHDGFGQVDHQSVVSIDEFLGGIDLEDFIFNSQYHVVISNDNI